MNTNELIALLSSDPLPSKPPAWHLPLAAVTALVVSMGLVLVGWGLHADLHGLFVSNSYQLKTVWLLVLALSSGMLLWRAARPARSVGYGMHGTVVSLLSMAGLGAYHLLQADPADRMTLLMGQSWWSCPLSIALIALPWLAVCLLYSRQMAPTRLAWCGASAGFLSGALATTLYSLHCAETSYAFFSVWYVAGMGLSTAVGAFLGPRYLRW